MQVLAGLEAAEPSGARSPACGCGQLFGISTNAFVYLFRKSRTGITQTNGVSRSPPAAARRRRHWHFQVACPTDCHWCSISFVPVPARYFLCKQPANPVQDIHPSRLLTVGRRRAAPASLVRPRTSPRHLQPSSRSRIFPCVRSQAASPFAPHSCANPSRQPLDHRRARVAPHLQSRGRDERATPPRPRKAQVKKGSAGGGTSQAGGGGETPARTQGRGKPPEKAWRGVRVIRRKQLGDLGEGALECVKGRGVGASGRLTSIHGRVAFPTACRVCFYVHPVPLTAGVISGGQSRHSACTFAIPRSSSTPAQRIQVRRDPQKELDGSDHRQTLMRGFSCVPRSEQWNESSRMSVGSGCVREGQYHRRRSETRRSAAKPPSSTCSQPTDSSCRPYALNHDADRVLESARVVGRVGCAAPPLISSHSKRL